MQNNKNRVLAVITKYSLAEKKFLYGLILTSLTVFSGYFNISAQSSAPQMIDVFFKYGDADYLDLSGKMVLPASSTVPQKNLESWVVGYKAWNLVGDYVYNPSFYYAINRERLKGATRTIEFRTISKYPDLAKRYQAIRPLSVNIVIEAIIDTGETGINYGYFKVSQNDLQYFESRSGKNLQNPVSPSSGKWKYAFSTDNGRNQFTEADSSDEKRLRELLKKYRGFRSSKGNGSFDIRLDIKWADDAIDEIGLLYDQYEKEDKKIDEELKAIKEAEKMVKPVTAYKKNDEMSMPFEAEVKSAEVFKEGQTVGLRSQGKVIFKSEDFKSAEPIKGSTNLFAFTPNDGWNGYHYYTFYNLLGVDGKEGQLDAVDSIFHLYNSQGTRVKLGEHSIFGRVFDFSQNGTYKILAVDGIINYRPGIYKTQNSYKGKPMNRRGYFTQQEFDDFKACDQINRCDVKYISNVNSYEYSYYQGTLYTVNSKLKIISKEVVYY